MPNIKYTYVSFIENLWISKNSSQISFALMPNPDNTENKCRIIQFYIRYFIKKIFQTCGILLIHKNKTK